MKKMTLRLEDLQIDSFETSSTRGKHGTVHGHDCITCTAVCNCYGTDYSACNCGTATCNCGTDYTDCGDCELSRNGGAAFTCDPECVSHYTDCHRC